MTCYRHGYLPLLFAACYSLCVTTRRHCYKAFWHRVACDNARHFRYLYLPVRSILPFGRCGRISDGWFHTTHYNLPTAIHPCRA